MLRVVSADSREAVQKAAVLFREYAASLTVDLSFQEFETELAGLPGDYAPPHGDLLLAFMENSPEGQAAQAEPELAGCVALRQLDSSTCEMKRLYIRPQFRGRGVGRGLARAAMDAARRMRYRLMRLDTLPEMTEAQALYRSLGFREIPPYRFNPVTGARFFEIDLPRI
jgi:putative acetyltransferase